MKLAATASPTSTSRRIGSDFCYAADGGSFSTPALRPSLSFAHQDGCTC